MDEATIKKLNALETAVRVLDGEGGAYSEADQQAAKLVLMDMILELERT